MCKIRIGLFVFMMSASFCLLGCSDKETEVISVEDSCTMAYEHIADSGGLTQEQINAGKEPFISTCIDYYSNMPVCKDEAAANLGCAMEITESEYSDLWDVIIPCEEKYNVDLGSAHDNDEFLACIKKIKTKCLKELTTWVLCKTIDQNRNKLKSYIDKDKDPTKAMAEAVNVNYLELVQVLFNSKAYEGLLYGID